MRLIVVLLPQPEGPKSATTPGVGSSNRTFKRNEPHCFSAATRSISGPACGARGARTIPTPAIRRAPAPPKERRDVPRRSRRPAPAAPNTAPAASVRVSPGMLETNVMTAPNSPNAAENAVIAPASTPGSISGRVIEANRSRAPAPSVRAASSSPRSMFSREMRTARTMSGKDITAVASAAPLRVKMSSMPNGPLEPCADGAARAEQQQQHITDRHRRQHQRQVHHRIEQGTSEELTSSEDPGEGDRGRQAERHAASRDAQAQAQRLAFTGAQPHHVHAPRSILCGRDTQTGS